jgi:hypothetical protein
MEQSLSGEPNSVSACQDIPHILRNPEVHLPHSQQPVTDLGNTSTNFILQANGTACLKQTRVRFIFQNNGTVSFKDVCAIAIQ